MAYVAKVGPGRAHAQPKHHVRPTHVTQSRVKQTRAPADAQTIPMAWLCHLQHVVVDGATSIASPVLSGVPQGSILGLFYENVPVL